MKYFVDSQGFLVGLNPEDGAIEVDAPELEIPSSNNKLVDGAWVLTDEVPQRVLDMIAGMNREGADKKAKEKRQALLQSTDWTDTASAPQRMGEALYGAWQTYRQALRDITKQPGYPLSIDWPAEPGA